MLNEALPLTSVAVPSTVAPSRNVTVPVGTPTAGATALTVALRVTACPTAEGLGVEARVVLVLPGLTVWITIAEVLARKVPPRVGAAGSAWRPPAREKVTSEALP